MKQKLIILLAALLSSQFVHARPLRVNLNASMISCGGTTELGTDELYILIRKQSIAGTRNFRLPFANGHWDVNPNGLRDIYNTDFGTVTIDDGETASFDIFLFEKDGGRVGSYLNLPSSLLQKVADNIEDSDDYIGGYRVVLTNSGNGDIHIKWLRLANTYYTTSEQAGPGTAEVHFNGDGSDYGMWLKVSIE